MKKGDNENYFLTDIPYLSESLIKKWRDNFFKKQKKIKSQFNDSGSSIKTNVLHWKNVELVANTSEAFDKLTDKVIKNDIVKPIEQNWKKIITLTDSFYKNLVDGFEWPITKSQFMKEIRPVKIRADWSSGEKKFYAFHVKVSTEKLDNLFRLEMVGLGVSFYYKKCGQLHIFEI